MLKVLRKKEDNLIIFINYYIIESIIIGRAHSYGWAATKMTICLLNINCSISYVTLDHKNSHEGQFTESEIYTLYSYGS